MKSPLNPIRRSCARRRYHVLALERGDLVDAPPPQAVTVRVVAEQELGRVTDFRDPEVEWWFRAAFNLGDTSVYAWQAGKVVGHFSSIRIPKKVSRVLWSRDRDALLTWGNVREDLRGRGIFQAMIRTLSAELFRDGVLRVVSESDFGAEASLAAHERCGFRVIGRADYLRVLHVVLRDRYVAT